MNWDEAQGKWKQMKGSVKERWGKLTDDDLTAISGSKDRLVGKVQERYGIAKEEAEQQVNSWKMPEGKRVTTRETTVEEMPRRKAS